MSMKPKRTYSTKVKKTEFNHSNLLDENYINGIKIVNSIDPINLEIISENAQPQIIKRLRSCNKKPIISKPIAEESHKTTEFSQNLFITPNVNRTIKLLRSNSCLTDKNQQNNNKKEIEPIKRAPSVIIKKKHSPKPIEHNNNNNNRYSLRSQSIRGRPAALDHLFLTPQRPKRLPLSELSKNSTPLSPFPPIKKAVYNSFINDNSRSSINSSISCLSPVLLSHFIKRTKMTTNDSFVGDNDDYSNIKKRRRIITVDSSIEDILDNNQSPLKVKRIENKSNMKISVSPEQDPEKKILELCGQQQVMNWSYYLQQLSCQPINKIGEGVYGEVFRLDKSGNVLKVFPVDGDVLTNSEEQMSMEDVYSELYVSRQLTELSNTDNRLFRTSNFVQLNKSSLLIGKLPRVFINQWKQYEREKGTENECLNFLPETQKWMTLEFEYAGQPLSEYRLKCYSNIRGIVEQITLSLAVAESSLQFEHRDLHWQNILIKPTTDTLVDYLINGRSYEAHCYGVFVTVIDFTVARMTVSESDVVYMDMADCPEIFEGEGDYQFDIYRMMKKDNNNNWRDFHPRSNLYWLHYLIDKLLNEFQHPRGQYLLSKTIASDMNSLHDRIMSYNSVQHLLDNDSYFSHCLKQ